MSCNNFCFSGFVCLLLAGSCQGAQVYRCPQPDGSISFQQQACAEGGTRVETGEAQAVWASLRSGERSLVEQYRERDKAILKHKQQISRSRKKPASADERSCWKKRQQLESVSAKLRRGYKASKGNELRRKRDSYEGYLRSFCP